MVIIQANNTEDALDDELVALGVPRERIWPGILPPNVQEQLRQHQQRTPTILLQSHVHEQPISKTA
jgi:hypothetical protein